MSGSLLIAGVVLAREQAWFYVELTPNLYIRAAPTREGLILSAVLIAWGLLTAGAAWSRSRGPELWVAEVLEEDLERQVFRLRVGYRGRGTAKAAAFVERVVDEKNQDAIASAQMPVELQWTHEGANTRPELSEHTKQTVGVVFAFFGAVGHVGSVRVADVMLRLHGMVHHPEAWTVQQFGGSRRLAVKVSLAIPGTSRQVIRWFEFTPDTTSRMLHKAIRLKADRHDNPIWTSETGTTLEGSR